VHDSSLVKGLVTAACRAVCDAGALRAAGVHVRVGSLSGISPGHLREHWYDAAAGTLLEGSSLLIEEGPDGPAALDDPDALGVLLVGLDVEDR